MVFVKKMTTILQKDGGHFFYISVMRIFRKKQIRPL